METDDDGAYVAWSTPDGGRGDAALPLLSRDRIRLILAVFREEGPALASQDPASVRERLLVAIDPDAALRDMLGAQS